MPAACGRASDADRAHEARPARCTGEQTRLQVDRRAGPDDRAVARELGVPVEEIQRHSAVSDHAGKLGAALNANERETFAELEIVDELDLRVVVYFTEDGEETIRPYVRCTPLAGLVEVKTGASMEELSAAQNEAHRIAEKLGVRANSDINITKNRAEIYVTDKERLEKAMSEAGVEMPEHAAVVEVDGLSRPM